MAFTIRLTLMLQLVVAAVASFDINSVGSGDGSCEANNSETDTCEYYIQASGYKYTCAELEKDYSLDCSGCDCGDGDSESTSTTTLKPTGSSTSTTVAPNPITTTTTTTTKKATEKQKTTTTTTTKKATTTTTTTTKKATTTTTTTTKKATTTTTTTTKKATTTTTTTVIVSEEVAKELETAKKYQASLEKVDFFATLKENSDTFKGLETVTSLKQIGNVEVTAGDSQAATVVTGELEAKGMTKEEFTQGEAMDSCKGLIAKSAGAEKKDVSIDRVDEYSGAVRTRRLRARILTGDTRLVIAFTIKINKSTESASSPSNEGLGVGGAVGIAVGVILGVGAIAGVAVGVVFAMKGKNNRVGQDQEKEKEKEQELPEIKTDQSNQPPQRQLTGPDARSLSPKATDSKDNS